MYIIYVNRRYVDYRIVFFILPLVIIATITNGYNSYLRWTQPIITVLSVWMLSLPLAHKENFYKKSQNK
jgi:fumarate reductase subunit C